MKYIYQQSRIKLCITLLKEASPDIENISDADAYSVFLYHNLDKTPIQCTVLNNVITSDWLVDLEPGVFSVRVLWVKDQAHAHPRLAKLMRVDIPDLFAITREPDEVTIHNDDVTFKVTKRAYIFGFDGLSAYELAVLRGTTTLTESQWVANVSEMNDRMQQIENSEGSPETSTPGDGTRWGAYKAAEENRDTQYRATEDRRNQVYEEHEMMRNDSFEDFLNDREEDYKKSEALRDEKYEAAENARDEAEKARVVAEFGRVNAEHQRDLAEAARAAEEAKRAEAERSRFTAEFGRVNAEHQRELAESRRDEEFKTFLADRESDYEESEASRDERYAAAEKNRDEAEKARVVAEFGRVNAEHQRELAEAARNKKIEEVEKRVDDVEEEMETTVKNSADPRVGGIVIRSDEKNSDLPGCYIAVGQDEGSDGSAGIYLESTANVEIVAKDSGSISLLSESGSATLNGYELVTEEVVRGVTAFSRPLVGTVIPFASYYHNYGVKVDYRDYTQGVGFRRTRYRAFLVEADGLIERSIIDTKDGFNEETMENGWIVQNVYLASEAPDSLKIMFGLDLPLRIEDLENRILRETQKWIGINLLNVIGDEEGASGDFYIYNRGNNSFLYENQQNNHTWKRPTLFKCTVETNGDHKEVRLRSQLSSNCWYLSDPTTSVGIPLPQFDNNTSQTRRMLFAIATTNIDEPLCEGVSYRFSKTNRNGGNLRYLEAQYIGTNDISSGQTENLYNEWLFITPEQYEDKRGRQ